MPAFFLLIFPPWRQIVPIIAFTCGSTFLETMMQSIPERKRAMVLAKIDAAHL